MDIKIISPNRARFCDVIPGDIFAYGGDNELYIKGNFTDAHYKNAISIRDGHLVHFDDSSYVKRVKSITVELE